VDPVEKAWVEKRLGWLAHVFGLERMRQAAVVLPTPDFFPDPYDGAVRDVRPLLDRVCQFMGVDAGRLTLDFYGDNSSYGSALGIYQPGPPETILINCTQLPDPLALVSTLAHEVAHALLLGDRQIDVTAGDHELVTDLLTVFLGMGVFGSNCVMRDSSKSTALMSWWSISKKGYLSEKLYAYAMALFAWGRGEARPDWAKHLRPNVRAPFAKGLDYLQRTGDSVFTPQAPFRDPSALDKAGSGSLLNDLQAPGAATRLAALWDLKLAQPAADTVMAPVWQLLRDSEALVRREAAEVLASLGTETRQAVPKLLEAAQLESNREVRQALIDAAMRLGGQACEVVPVIVKLVEEEPATRASTSMGPAKPKSSPRSCTSPSCRNSKREPAPRSRC